MKNAFSVQGVVTAWGQAICISRCISRSTSRCEIRSARMQGIAGRRPADLGGQKGRWPAQRSPLPICRCRPPGSSVRKVIRGLTPPAGHVSPSGRRGAARRGESALQTRKVAGFRCRSGTVTSLWRGTCRYSSYCSWWIAGLACTEPFERFAGIALGCERYFRVGPNDKAAGLSGVLYVSDQVLPKRRRSWRGSVCSRSTTMSPSMAQEKSGSTLKLAKTAPRRAYWRISTGMC